MSYFVPRELGKFRVISDSCNADYFKIELFVVNRNYYQFGEDDL